MVTHTEMSISGRFRITLAALKVIEDRVTGLRSSLGQVSPGASFPGPKVDHPPRFPDLPVAFFRILIDDPTGEVAHLM
jgi:hypothetical protein